METQLTTLSNGLRIVTSEVPSEFVNINAFFFTGARNDFPDRPGLSHFLEHMVLNGTENKNRVALWDYVDNLGGNINGYTNNSSLWFLINVDAEDTDKGVELLAELIQNPAHREQDLEKERGIVMQEIRNKLENKQKMTSLNRIETAYSNKFFKNMITGREPEVIERISRQDLYDYMNVFFKTNNLVISAAGKVDHQSFVELVKNQFNKLESGIIPDSETPLYCGGMGITGKDTKSLVLSLGFDGGSAHYNGARSLLQKIMGSHGRIIKRIREKESLTYSAGFLAEDFCEKNLAYTTATSSQDNANKILTLMTEEIKKICNDYVTPEELETAKKKMITSEKRAWESISAMSLAPLFDLRTMGRLISTDEIRQSIEAVTKEDILAEAQKIFATKLTYAVYGEAPGIYSYEEIENLLK